MTNKERFHALMAGRTPDRVPLLIFSELLPGNVYEDLIAPHDGGLIVHAGSVHARRRTVRETHEYRDGLHIHALHAPSGTIQSAYRTGCEALSGSGEVQVEWFVKEERDYEPMIEALDDTEFYLDDAGYLKAVAQLGGRGVTHTWCDEPPYMGLQYLLGYERWALHQFDCPEAFNRLIEAYGRMQRRRMALQQRAPEKDLINLGNLSGNYAPAQFERRARPYFEEYGQLLRQAGCSVTVHADALNLAEHLNALPRQLDVVEAFTPPPVGDLTLRRARAAWGDALVFHINIPETIFYLGFDFCYQWTRALLEEDKGPRKFLSFTELGFLGVAGAQMDTFTQGMRGVLSALDDFGGY